MGDFHSPMQIKRRPSVSDRPHHQTCVGAAKAEAVVQYGLHLPLLGYMGNEIHASAILARVIQVQRWWHDLVAHRQHAEYGLDCACSSKQMADGRFGRSQGKIAERPPRSEERRVGQSVSVSVDLGGP